jgi:cyclophilin family peptidyl-prolyl cis-trans isomerase
MKSSAGFKITRTQRAAGLAFLAAGLSPAFYSASAEAKELPNKPALTDVVKASTAADWRPLDAGNTLYLELPAGRVVIEMAPYFAPDHAANIKALVREGYFDGLVIMRAQDNYVVQWGDPDNRHTVKAALKERNAELTRVYDKDLVFNRLPDADGYAPQVGFSNGFPAARDPKTHRAWLAHCYGMMGAGRDNAANSGVGTELYVVIGHSPRQLDRNVVLFGRVMKGMELLSTLPRGTGALGFYEKPEQYVPISSMRMAADVPAAERSDLEVMRTDTRTFANAVEAVRNRGGAWFKEQAGYVNLCNVPIVVRERK